MLEKQTQLSAVSAMDLQRYAAPLLVPDENETEELWTARWRTFRELPESVRDRIIDEKNIHVITRIAERVGLDVEQMAFLARAVRLYYFGELALEDFADYFVQNIGVAPMTAQNIARTLISQIIKKQVKDTKERLTLRVALDRFHTLKDQVITEEPLMVAGAQKRSPGSIENWITDYHLAVGQGKHTAIERGNYLFHNRNTKPLSAASRQRVAMVLKSFDEDMAMVVDTARGEIVFPEAQKVPQREGVAQQPAQAPTHGHVQHAQHHQKDDILQTQDVRSAGVQPAGYVNFSSGQKLSREREQL